MKRLLATVLGTITAATALITILRYSLRDLFFLLAALFGYLTYVLVDRRMKGPAPPIVSRHQSTSSGLIPFGGARFRSEWLSNSFRSQCNINAPECVVNSKRNAGRCSCAGWRLNWFYFRDQQ